MSLENLTDQQALMPMMGKLMKELKAIITSEFQANDVQLTKEQAIVLKKLCDKDGRPQNDLAIVTSRDKTSLTRLLTTMERKNLIVRKQSNLDKRVNLVFITDKARNEIKKAIPVVLQIFNRAIKDIDDERIEGSKTLLLDIYNNLNINHEE